MNDAKVAAAVHRCEIIALRHRVCAAIAAMMADVLRPGGLITPGYARYSALLLELQARDPDAGQAVGHLYDLTFAFETPAPPAPPAPPAVKPRTARPYVQRGTRVLIYASLVKAGRPLRLGEFAADNPGVPQSTIAPCLSNMVAAGVLGKNDSGYFEAPPRQGLVARLIDLGAAVGPFTTTEAANVTGARLGVVNEAVHKALRDGDLTSGDTCHPIRYALSSNRAV